MSNDELRQTWMAAVVPFMEEVDIDVPAHWDDEQRCYVIDCPFPARFDAEAKRWLLDQGTVSWDDVMTRWKGRGPMNADYVARLQRGYRSRRAAARAP
jgi:ring-1,2-phenylacetyl-CoA epoxidase subunit PaaA